MIVKEYFTLPQATFEYKKKLFYTLMQIGQFPYIVLSLGIYLASPLPQRFGWQHCMNAILQHIFLKGTQLQHTPKVHQPGMKINFLMKMSQMPNVKRAFSFTIMYKLNTIIFPENLKTKYPLCA